MNRFKFSIVIAVAISSVACLTGCGDGGGAVDPNQAAASRDSQMQSLGQQRQGAGGNKSADAAGKAAQPGPK